jgi:hypothetical protein
VVEIQILVIFCDERKLYLNIWSLFFLSKLMRVMYISTFKQLMNFINTRIIFNHFFED